MQESGNGHSPLIPLAARWRCKGGFAEVLWLAAPLILSTGSLAVQEFVDRMFLSWYSAEAIAASMPSGILYFTILSLFLGTASYVNTFVAQYHGAAHPARPPRARRRSPASPWCCCVLLPSTLCSTR